MLHLPIFTFPPSEFSAAAVRESEVGSLSVRSEEKRLCGSLGERGNHAADPLLGLPLATAHGTHVGWSCGHVSEHPSAALVALGLELGATAGAASFVGSHIF